MVIAQDNAVNAGGQNFEFMLYKPERLENDPLTWTCRYRVISDGINIDHKIYGVSSLQALALALNIVAVRAGIYGVNLAFASVTTDACS